MERIWEVTRKTFSLTTTEMTTTLTTEGPTGMPTLSWKSRRKKKSWNWEILGPPISQNSRFQRKWLRGISQSKWMRMEKSRPRNPHLPQSCLPELSWKVLWPLLDPESPRSQTPTSSAISVPTWNSTTSSGSTNTCPLSMASRLSTIALSAKALSW